jgi:hypothetical protein
MTIVGYGGDATDVLTLLWHTPDPVQAASPPPDTDAVFVTEDAVLRDTFTGTVMTMGVTAPVATVHPVRLAAPAAGHPESFPLLVLFIVTAPLVVIPVGNESDMEILPVVGPLATAMVSV